MKNCKKIYVVYHAGSFGSWVRWLIEYGNDVGHRHKHIPDNPVISNGSSHGMVTLPNSHPGGLAVLDTLSDIVDEPCGYKVYRALPIIDNITTLLMDIITRFWYS
jgi:hypothetical protein